MTASGPKTELLPRDKRVDDILVDWDEFRATRTQLGAAFVRILGYFREDGTKSVAAIEDAMRARDARGLVMPAHTLKGESRQFGAERLAELAEDIEMFARHCVEAQVSPEEYLPRVVELRPLFEQTLAALEREANPLVQRRAPGFGRAVGY
ncbi:Hpt domain-containing protein [Sphingopyxis sp. YF1]|jgi:HPt (histidine-containing phosphotransfer) domain-containing protein|uniref:Hpt domain-containing protein n=1 Tax=Sphingopyxis sp. YF1 TaxID=2482763 RepID=UPI001F6019A8|nr:Hpt domain-containing protein [Sphingopyxis sp. YF1]UNU41694.1 Hpt domain-containing protein [Sphingopyxis sp. YF1]